MANSKQLAANINFVIDDLTTIGVIKEAKALAKALNKDKATKQYLADDLVSWIGDELRECADLIRTNYYEYEVFNDDTISSMLHISPYNNQVSVYIYAQVFIKRFPLRFCGLTMSIKNALEPDDYCKYNRVIGLNVSRCYHLEVEDGKVKEITRCNPTY